MSDPTIFDVIDHLKADLPLTPDKVAKALGARIARDRESDTAAVEAWGLPENVKGGRYETVDLRMPDADIGDGSVFLSVTTRTDEGIDQAAICERYGTEFQAEVPSPRYKPGTIPVYLTFELEGSSLSFGVTADERRRFVRFVLTTHAASA